MYRIKRGKWNKDYSKEGYLLPKKQDWLQQHSPSRQSKRSHQNQRKPARGK